LLFRNRFRQLNQPANTCGQAGAIVFDPARSAKIVDRDKKRDQSTVPSSEFGRIETDAYGHRLRG
jgi:hypothetical protein